MSRIVPSIAMLTASLAAFLYAMSEFMMTGSLAMAPDADVEQLGMLAWLWGVGSLVFFALTAYLGWRIVMIIKPPEDPQ